MNKDTCVIFRVNSTLKKEVEQIVQNYGFSLSSVLTSFMISIQKKNAIPLSLRPEAAKLSNKIYPNDYYDIVLAALRYYVANCPVIDHVEKMYLFGSYARKEATESSDFDIRVKFNKQGKLMDLIDIQDYLREKLHKDVDVVCPNDDDEFLDIIKEDEILIYDSSKERCAIM